MGEARLAKNYALLSIGESLSKVFNFLSFTFLSRELGAAVYGDLEFSLAATLVFALFVQMGLGSYGAREIARQPKRAQELLSEIMAVRMWMSLISLAALIAFAAFVNKPAEVKLLILAYGVSLLLVPGLALWFFQGHDHMQWVAAAHLVRHGAFAACVFGFYRGGNPLWWIGAFEVGSVTVCVLFGYWIVTRRMGYRPVVPKMSLSLAWVHLRQAVPIGLSNMTWALLWLSPLVVLGMQVNDASLGWFAASHRITMALHTFVWWYFFNLLPAISRTAAGRPQELQGLMDRSMSIVCWGSIFVAVIGTLVADQALGLAFGKEFFDGGVQLALLVWCIPIAAISGHYRYMLIGYDLQHWLLLWTAIGATIAVTATYVLAPVYGATAGAGALIFGNVICLALCYLTARRRIQPISFWRRLATPTAGAIAVAALVLTPLAANQFLMAVAGVGLYASVFAWAQRRDLPVWWRALSARLT